MADDTEDTITPNSYLNVYRRKQAPFGEYLGRNRYATRKHAMQVGEYAPDDTYDEYLGTLPSDDEPNTFDSTQFGDA